MKTTLPFDLTVDRSTKTAIVSREFNAGLTEVWDAFTKKDILDQWWAPKPFASKSKIMEFKVGGRRVYAMVTPEGHERWSVWSYTSISPTTNFKMFSAFADKDENLELPGSNWDFNFSEEGGPDSHRVTKVRISIKNESLARMEQMIEMGFAGGIAATLQQLEELLTSKNR